MKRAFNVCIVLIFALVAIEVCAAKKKKPKMEPVKPVGAKPEIQRLEPRGVQRGISTRIQLKGTNFIGLTEIKSNNKKLKFEIDESVEEKETEAWMTVTVEKDVPRGGYDISAVNEKGESAKVKLYVDDFPHFHESATNKMEEAFNVTTPVTFWGVLEPAADSDRIEFNAKTGQNLVIDLAAKSIGSKANVMISLFDAQGNALASNNGFDAGDPLLSYKIPATGRYSLRISDEQLNGSPDHFYRVCIGELPTVVTAFPLSVKAGVESEMTLVGFNLPTKSTTVFKADKTGEMEVPVDLEKYRLRKSVKALVTAENEITENEPNDQPAEATPISIPVNVGGRIWKAAGPSDKTIAQTDADLYLFQAKASQVIVVETDAARRGSPVDTKVEVLYPDGKPVERVLLQSVRDSHLNFRPIDSFADNPRVENWEEMELNEFMYLQGEVCRILRMPEGPDSGFQFYKNLGKRITYFDTSATAHALDELCYVVEPHPPGTRLVPNGLPAFTINYVNDDDGERELGVDSRLTFTAPADGSYLIRVTDNRGSSGDRFSYRLLVREAAPDFKITMGGANPTVSPGSCQEFTFTVDRIDGFDNDITLELAGLPEGLITSTPLVIQSGHLQAQGSICAASDAKEPSKEAMAKIQIKASALVNSKTVVKNVTGFGQIKIGEKPKLLVAMEPYEETKTNFTARTISDPPIEITVKPGETTPIWLKMKRDGHEELVSFTVDNLPHGVIVDNIGLNGVLIPKGENERQIFLRCAKWLPDTDRLAYCQARQAGNPTSFPVLIRVRSSSNQQTAKAD